MNHKPIQFKDAGLIYPHKTCFENFNGEIRAGDSIALIGRNGVGKSTLLKMLAGLSVPSIGDVVIPADVRCGYLPQVIEDFLDLSGGQRLNHTLTQVLSDNPGVLLLDEPTNHLDKRNRCSLIRMLEYCPSTLVIASHDTELINTVTNTLWHIESGKITVFRGTYAEYQEILKGRSAAIEKELAKLSRQKKEAHLYLMKEQENRKRLRIAGEKKIETRKWPTIRSHSKLANAVTTGDKHLKHINHKKQQLLEEKASIYQPKSMNPKFVLNGLGHHKSLVCIRDGCVAYVNNSFILKDIQLSFGGLMRVALIGDNASGKSTFVKALLNDERVHKSGEWVVPNIAEIGYLEQHYQHLNPDETALDLMHARMPHATYTEIRAHLNDFLFCKNEEVGSTVKNLSGGEKARLSMALIAANPPKLLILDEITNNIDMETRTHIIQVLRDFPGAMLVISHDNEFLNAIQIETQYQIHQGRICHLAAIDE